MIGTRVACVAALSALVACGGSSTTSSTPTTASPCVTVAQPAKDRLGVPVLGATKAPPDVRGVARWYYSTADGATWVSGADPTTGEARAPSLPMNDKARAASTLGVDVPAGSPAFGAANDFDPDAAASRQCAQHA